MIISDIDKFIFIHNPKCGGTTVRRSLARFDSRNDYYWMFLERYGVKVDKAHLPIELLRIYFPNEFSLMEKYFVFGFVRDPIDRFVSSFNEANQLLYKKVIALDMSENAYLEKINQCAVKLNERNVSGLDFGFRHFVEQNKMFYSEGKCYADSIIKIEAMDSCPDIFRILKENLVEASMEWNVSKVNVKKLEFSPRDGLTLESLNNLKKVYRNDFILFGY